MDPEKRLEEVTVMVSGSTSLAEKAITSQIATNSLLLEAMPRCFPMRVHSNQPLISDIVAQSGLFKTYGSSPT